jgi:uncharacterized membrane protein (UPF0127 family)
VLIVWPANTLDPFWLKKTTAPLDVAFIGGQGDIVEIRSMTRPAEELAQPQQPYRLVIVTNREYFEGNNIRPGSRAVFAVSP